MDPVGYGVDVLGRKYHIDRWGNRLFKNRHGIRRAKADYSAEAWNRLTAEQQDLGIKHNMARRAAKDRMSSKLDAERNKKDVQNTGVLQANLSRLYSRSNFLSVTIRSPMTHAPHGMQSDMNL